MRLHPVSLFLAAVTLAGCGPSNSPRAGATATPQAGAATASPSPSPAALSLGAEIFSDPLDKDNGHEWPIVDDASYSAKYTGGTNDPGYIIIFKQPELSVSPHASMRGITKEMLRDYAVTVSPQVPGVYFGTGDEYGVVCRDLSKKRYGFVATLAPNKSLTFTIFKKDSSVEPTKRTDLATRTVPRLGHQGPITGVCTGGSTGKASLRLYTQGSESDPPELVVKAEDASSPLTEGYPGIYLGGGSADSKPRFVFRRFLVRAATGS